MNELECLLDSDNAIIAIKSGKIDKNLKRIEKEVLSIVPDTTTTKGRKEIASLAHKVSKSKVALDNAGKDLAAEWKAKVKLIDASRKHSRDFLDNLRDTVRYPLTLWEKEEKRKLELAKMAEERRAELAKIELLHNEALAYNDLFDREEAIAEKERIAEERAAEELRQKEVKELKAKEELRINELKKRAAEDAKTKAEHETEEEKLRIEREAQARVDAAKRLQAEAIAREERLKRQIAEAKEAKIKAAEDAEMAIKKAAIEAREEAQRKALIASQERITREANDRRLKEVAAADVSHKRNVNNIAVECFIKELDIVGLSPLESAKMIVRSIATGRIKGVTINY